MTSMEEALTDMHVKTNNIFKMRNQIEDILKDLPKDEKYSAVRKEGEALVKKCRHGMKT
jgi:hypothetical protein